MKEKQVSLFLLKENNKKRLIELVSHSTGKAKQTSTVDENGFTDKREYEFNSEKNWHCKMYFLRKNVTQNFT